jgi:hypothetical protein
MKVSWGNLAVETQEIAPKLNEWQVCQENK